MSSKEGRTANFGAPVVRSRRVASILLGGYLVVVALIVLAPSAAVPTESVAVIYRALQALGAPGWFSPNVVEFCTNVLLFMPLSFLGATFRPAWGWGRWLLVGVCLSGTIELTQLLFLSARSASLVDVASNSLGALLGYLCVVLARRLT